MANLKKFKRLIGKFLIAFTKADQMDVILGFPPSVTTVNGSCIYRFQATCLPNPQLFKLFSCQVT